MEHILIGLQRSGDENIIKRDSGFNGIESYLMIKWEEDVNHSQVSRHIFL